MTHPRLDRIAKGNMATSFAVALYGQARGDNALVLGMFAVMLMGAGLWVWNGGKG